MTLSALDTVITPIRREGWPFIFAFAVAALVLAMAAKPLGWIGFLLTVWCAYFFRDPARVTPTEPGLVISPADGLVQSIGPALPPPELGMGCVVPGTGRGWSAVPFLVSRPQDLFPEPG